MPSSGSSLTHDAQIPISYSRFQFRHWRHSVPIVGCSSRGLHGVRVVCAVYACGFCGAVRAHREVFYVRMHNLICIEYHANAHDDTYYTISTCSIHSLRMPVHETTIHDFIKCDSSVRTNAHTVTKTHTRRHRTTHAAARRLGGLAQSAVADVRIRTNTQLHTETNCVLHI